MTRWTDERDLWIQTVSDADLLRLVGEVAMRYGETDETGGDHTETRESILWLISRGKKGRDWGHAGVAARDLGLWPTDHKAG